MSNVNGVVEVIMTNKYDKEKIAMKLVDNDTWYNQKREFMDTMPNRGDTVSFSPGKTKDGEPAKYIQYLEIVSRAANDSSNSGGSNKSYGNTLGIELGHAANNATTIAVAKYGKSVKVEQVMELTKEFYEGMKCLREEFEKPKNATAEKPKTETQSPIEDEDIPF